MKSIKLYKPDEYPVKIGNPKSDNALCIVWQDLDRVVEYNPFVVNDFAIIGNLRSVFGINVMIYNLARNPHIQNLYIWAPDSLSNTEIGKAGKEALVKLWATGEYEFVPEIDKQYVYTMIKRIKLIEHKDKKPPVVKTLKDLNNRKIPQPMMFKDFKIRAPETFPSENYTYAIRTLTGAEGFSKLLYTIWKYGSITKIDAQGQKVKEIRGAIIVVEDESDEIFLPDWLSKHPSFAITRASLTQYCQTQFSDLPYKKKLYKNVYTFIRPRDYTYLYAELLFAFPRPHELEIFLDALEQKTTYDNVKQMYIKTYSPYPKKDRKWIHVMEKKIKKKKDRLRILREHFLPRVNQVDYVIQRIHQFPDDLDKEINLWDVRKNVRLTSGRPCLNKLSFSVRNKRVDLHAFFRSHDIGKAWFYNYYGIRSLQRYVADKTGYACGHTIIESESAHIYERDFKRVEEFINDIFINRDPRMFFDPKTDSDRRGSIFIKVIGKEIMVVLQDPLTGKSLMELKGKTARQLIYALRHHDLISRTDHALFIGSELAKAEICLKKGIPYKYDSVLQV